MRDPTKIFFWEAFRASPALHGASLHGNTYLISAHLQFHRTSTVTQALPAHDRGSLPHLPLILVSQISLSTSSPRVYVLLPAREYETFDRTLYTTFPIAEQGLPSRTCSDIQGHLLPSLSWYGVYSAGNPSRPPYCFTTNESIGMKGIAKATTRRMEGKTRRIEPPGEGDRRHRGLYQVTGNGW